ncbi:MAG: general stress protein CsbD [Chitinophagales bacterium]
MEDLFLHLKAPWNEVRERIKESNIDITDADLDLQPGKEDELLARLESKMHKSREEMRNWIESISWNAPQAG